MRSTREEAEREVFGVRSPEGPAPSEAVTGEQILPPTDLEKYGRHWERCAVNADTKDRVYGIDFPTPNCDCGFSAALLRERAAMGVLAPPVAEEELRQVETACAAKSGFHPATGQVSVCLDRELVRRIIAAVRAGNRRVAG